jgi:PhoPQ-activated pathogenicity-related protein
VGTGARPARADLLGYVKKADPSFAWKLNKTLKHPQGTVYDLHLVSQKWKGITWEHQLQVYQPKGVAPTATMLLWNQGGKAGLGSIAFGMILAQKIKAPVAFLFGIPNQPLLGGKKEDTLIAETFVRYLKTQDEDWPLLFPMVKSLVKAMDALQAFSKKEWKKPVKKFIVSGASKRGWTTWLTGAADPRVKAIAPAVIDTLRMREQMVKQVKDFGKYSEQIGDYVKRGLVPMPKVKGARKLWTMVDPYFYRDRITVPKLIVNGKGDHTRAVNGLAAFARHYVKDNPMPKLSWKHDQADGKLRLTVEAKPAPTGARLWVADAMTRDFRQSTWVSRPAQVKKGKISAAVERPKKGYRAFYAEVDYEMDGIAYHLSTQLRVAGPSK